MKKYTLTFFMGKSNNIEKIERVNCDFWVEISEDVTPKIFCFKGDDRAIGYPSTSLRKIVQNFGVENEMNTDVCEKFDDVMFI